METACQAQSGKTNMNWFNGKDAALEKAIDRDDPAAVDAALRDGANVNARGRTGATPLMYAIGHFRKNAYRELLQRGADPAQRDDERDNAVTLAASAFGKDRDYLSLALDRGADPNTLEADDDPILVRFIDERNLGAIDLLKEHGANLDIRDRTKRPAIIGAAIMEYWDVVWHLLQLGARYDYKDQPITMETAFRSPEVTPPDSPLWPYKVKSWKFLRDHGMRLPDLPGAP